MNCARAPGKQHESPVLRAWLQADQMQTCGDHCADHSAAEGRYHILTSPATAQTAGHTAGENVQCHQGMVHRLHLLPQPKAYCVYMCEVERVETSEGSCTWTVFVQSLSRHAICV